MSRVMVAMSGGVDSSVAAAVLVREGYEVVGGTLKLFLAHECAGAATRAQQVCEILSICHYTLDLTIEFEKQVIDYFCAEYQAGRTPNPCLRCNQLIKWGELLRCALGYGCEYLATGHYAVVQQCYGRYSLRRGQDPDKDQSYALYGLTQPQLSRTLLPLGGYTKQQVREIAQQMGLPATDSSESQDICFIPGGDYRQFLQSRVDFTPGPIRDSAGQLLGTHQGLPAYTVGQRHGLGIGGGPPLYVIAKDVADNALIVGPREDLCRRQCEVAGVNWVSIAPPEVGETVEAAIELRYRARPIAGTVAVTGPDTARVSLAAHNQAVSPGQVAVFYRDDLLLGGGIISG